MHQQKHTQVYTRKLLHKTALSFPFISSLSSCRSVFSIHFFLFFSPIPSLVNFTSTSLPLVSP